MKRIIAGAACIALGLAGVPAVLAQPQSAATPPRPVFAPDGTVHVPAFDLPPSTLISPEALAAQRARAGTPHVDFMGGQSVAALRAQTERALEPDMAEMKARYDVDVVEQTIGGVRTRIVTPKDGEADPTRVLINLHGGGFMMCAENCAMVESIPIAATGRFRVVTVDYRMGPENAFPAASEDIAAVYQELLKRYRPQNIGVYGCSAGGALTAQSMAWFADKHIPMPGAAGIFGAGGVLSEEGDSGTVTAFTDGSFGPPPASGKPTPAAYFRGVALSDRLVSPALYPDILARFPPTIIITGTRAKDMSPALYTNNQLLKAGVNSRLIVGEGMGHCYIYQANLPEARDAYVQIVRFFNENLGSGGKGAPPPVRRPEPVAETKPPRAVDKCAGRATNARVASPGADGKFFVKPRDPKCSQ